MNFNDLFIKACVISIFFLTFLGFSSCKEKSKIKQSSNDVKKNIPENIKKIRNLKVFDYQKKLSSAVKIRLKKKHVFKSNDNVFIGGFIDEIDFDNNNNVYILSQKPGFVKIYRFDSTGSFKNKFLREGRGPGEFEAIISMSISHNKLYALGGRLQKIGVFSLRDHSLINEFSIDKENLKNNNLTKTLIARKLYVLDDGTLIVSMSSNLLKNKYHKKYLYKINKNEKLSKTRLLELRKHRLYETPRRDNNKGYNFLPFTLPVNRSSIISVSKKGKIYTTWTENFLIKVYDNKGSYRFSIYSPYENAPANLSNISINDRQERFLTNEDIPDTWPVLQSMVLDDENRIWISTITKSDSTFRWLVLNNQGELMATFEAPGKKKHNNPGVPPMIKIKDGFFYKRAIDVKSGVNEVVKYKIRFKKN